MVGSFAAITSVARLAQDGVIAWRFGTGPVVDAYYFVVSLANWPVAVALSLFTLLLVPLEAAQQQDEAEKAEVFRRELFGCMLLVAGAILPLAWWAMTEIASRQLAGTASAAVAVGAVPAMAPVVPLGVLGALLSAWLIAAGRNVLALLEAIPALVLVAIVLVVPGPVLFWATALGVGVQLLAVALTLRRLGLLPRPRVGFTSPAWHGLGAGATLLLAAQVFSALLPLVDAFFAARLGEGTLATLNFANRLVLGLQGLAGLAVQRVSLPLFSRLASESSVDTLRAVVRWAALMGALGLAIALGVALAAGPLVQVVFERGHFTAADREQVATLLRWGVLQLTPFLAGVPIVAALASTRARASLAVAGALGLLVKVAVSALLLRAEGAIGLQIATAVMYSATTALAWLFLRQRLRGAAGWRP